MSEQDKPQTDLPAANDQADLGDESSRLPEMGADGIPNPKEVYENGVKQVAVPIDIPPFGELSSSVAVRAVFGLSDIELPDDVLTQEHLGFELGIQLEALMAQNEADWQTISASEEAKDQKIVRAAKNWATYALADKVCDVLPLLVARAMSDSKASVQRFDIDLNQVIANVSKRLATATELLKSALDDGYQREIKTPNLFTAAKPAYDPVTGQTT